MPIPKSRDLGVPIPGFSGLKFAIRKSLIRPVTKGGSRGSRDPHSTTEHIYWHIYVVNMSTYYRDLPNVDLQLHQNAFGGLALYGPTEGALTALPRPPSLILGVGTGKGREGKGDGERTRRKEREGKGERKEEGRDHPQ